MKLSHAVFGAEGPAHSGRSYRDLMAAYYRVAPAEVIDGRTLVDFIAMANAAVAAFGSERVHAIIGALAADDRLPTASGGIISFRSDVTEQKVSSTSSASAAS